MDKADRLIFIMLADEMELKFSPREQKDFWEYNYCDSVNDYHSLAVRIIEHYSLKSKKVMPHNSAIDWRAFKEALREESMRYLDRLKTDRLDKRLSGSNEKLSKYNYWYSIVCRLLEL